MANKALFGGSRRATVRATERNAAGGLAYKHEPRQALAQLIATGTLNATFYGTAEGQLDELLLTAGKVAATDPAFVAKAAFWARVHGSMKDAPAILLAVLAAGDVEARVWFARAFPLVCDNGRMVRNFVQVLRSGVTGRRSLGTLPKRLIRDWLARRTESQLLADSIGVDPSLADIVKMVHPRPETETRRAFYAWLIGRKVERDALPADVAAYDRFRKDPQGPIPDVPWMLLTSLPLTGRHWREIALRMRWQATRINLNTLLRHGVFESEWITEEVAKRLEDPEALAKSKAFPYQLFTAWLNGSGALPKRINEALNRATESSVGNVPIFPGPVHVAIDVSGSMSWSVTGYRRGRTSKTTCRQVAALIAATLMRRSPMVNVIPFDDKLHLPKRLSEQFRREDPILATAERLAKFGGGGTNCSLPLRHLNETDARGDLVVLVSDNESWMDSKGRSGYSGTRLLAEWERYRRRNPNAKLVCIDLVPNTTTQALERRDVMNVGGFSDSVFRVLHDFATDRINENHWVGEINSLDL